jgi:site-specific DNA-adenine methylase
MINNYPGNKRLLAKRIKKFIPENFSIYIEPFSGSFFIYFLLDYDFIKNKKIIYNDLDLDLVNLFKDIKNNKLENNYLIEILKTKENYTTFLKNLEIYKQHLNHIDIFENMSYEEVIKKYDSKDSFFYIDPPYYNKEYVYKYSLIDHINLNFLLKSIKGKFLLSYSYFDNMYELYKDFNIIKISNGYQKEYLIHN